MGHAWHCMLPLELVNAPELHEVYSDVVELGQRDPGGHSWHCVEAVVEAYLPASQGSHARMLVAPVLFALNVPVGQSMQDAWPSSG